MSTPDGGDTALARDLVCVVRALSALNLGDLRLAASVRLQSGRVLATPRPGGGAPVPGDLAPADLVELDGEGRVLVGRWPAPIAIAADLELYRRRPEVHAVVHAQPMTALAFAAAGRTMEPLTHTEATLLYPALPVIGRGAAVGDAAAARALADALGGRPVALLTGNGSVAAGATIAEAGMLSHQVELLAKVNAVAALQPGPAAGARRRTVGEPDSARIAGQKAPAADFQGYFDAVAAERTSRPTPDSADDTEAGLRRRIVAACELLYHHGLVQSLEHVSVRLPDRSGFLMTPRRHLGRLRPEEIAIVGMDGTWRSGPLPPPPFLWFHRDVLAARPEVLAIVHTHQLLVRGLVMAGATIRPLYRGGAHWAATPAAIHETPDLLFDAGQRAAAMATLGAAVVMHEAAHGSDFLSDSVEAATVGALQLEHQAGLWALASRLTADGREPRPLDEDVLSRLPDEEPTDLDWWRYFRSELPADPAGGADPARPSVAR